MHRFLPYILKSMVRTPVRTWLTIGIVAMATFIFAYLMAYGDSWNRMLDAAGSNAVLVVAEKNQR
ncbi:MAG: hypothetical protein E3J72_06325 [Planctomycetota bacterium]|nr:MAG: hypothetical protein E3J72_06325 [Planctomycetota bacterium]